MKRAARIALWAIGALMWLAVGASFFASACCRWIAQDTTPADWLTAVALGLVVGGLAGAGF